MPVLLQGVRICPAQRVASLGTRHLKLLVRPSALRGNHVVRSEPAARVVVCVWGFSAGRVAERSKAAGCKPAGSFPRWFESTPAQQPTGLSAVVGVSAGPRLAQFTPARRVGWPDGVRTAELPLVIGVGRAQAPALSVGGPLDTVADSLGGGLRVVG